MDRLGMARLGIARSWRNQPVSDSLSRLRGWQHQRGAARCGQAWQCQARHCWARLGMAWQGKEGQGLFTASWVLKRTHFGGNTTGLGMARTG